MSHGSFLDINLAFRPRSYFWADKINVNLSSSIKGAARKLLYERSVADGETLPARLLKPALTCDERRAWGRLHPRLMGGEYLPDRSGGEVEIARIAIASTTQDVTSVYARATKNRIHYRVVDEYGADTLSEHACRTSVQPLVLGQLIDFFFGAWDLMAVLEMNFERDGYPPDEVHDFVTDASSTFYQQFGTLVHQRIDNWLDSVGPQPSPSKDDTGATK